MRETPAARDYTYDEVVLPVADGRSIVVWHVHADDPKALVLVVRRARRLTANEQTHGATNCDPPTMHLQKLLRHTGIIRQPCTCGQ